LAEVDGVGAGGEPKFLADANVERGIVELLRSMGFEVKWVADLGRSIEDEQVLRLAEEEARILITNDKDFGDFVFRQRREVCGLILFRVKGQDTSVKVELMKKLLEENKDKLKGRLIVVTRDRFRFTPIGG
jgi:predicted nuclease of predicted toxin-antitoxin system